MAQGHQDACAGAACGLTHSGAALTDKHTGALRKRRKYTPCRGHGMPLFSTGDTLLCLTRPLGRAWVCLLLPQGQGTVHPASHLSGTCCYFLEKDTIVAGIHKTERHGAVDIKGPPKHKLVA